MENFDKPNIISEVAINKNSQKFLPRNIQIELNNVLKNKLFRFYNEMKDEMYRPHTMKKFDSMMNDLKGDRMKNLYMYRRQGNHIINLLCHSIPPEIIYAIDNHVPTNVCMAAGELEIYADSYTKGMCPLTRSMIGLNNTGMCVFFNVADYAIGNELCCSIKKTTDIFNETCNDLKLFLLESKENNGTIEVNYKGFVEWVHLISEGKGFNREKFVTYAKLFSEIRNTYKQIMQLRKADNPPINGRNSLWIQQLFLVSEPYELLSSLNFLKAELEDNIKNGIGFNKNSTKKRVLLISPRTMTPFAEIVRIIENTDAVIVAEEMCMGISNVAYDINKLLPILENNDNSFEEPVRYMLETLDRSECSCSNGFDINRIMDKIIEYRVDAVINFSFNNCPCMEQKIQEISKKLNSHGVPVKNIISDYIEIYDNADNYTREIKTFLNIK